MQENTQEKSPIKKKILQFLDYKGMSQYEFYQKTGVTRGVLTQNNGISEENISRFLACFPEVSIDWLLTGQGEMLKTMEKNEQSQVVYGKGTPYFAVDFVAGFDIIYNNQTSVPDNYIYVPQYRNADCWVDVTGDSMSPLIVSGDIVALKKIADWENNIFGGEIYAIVTEQWRTIKKVRLIKNDADKLLLVPINPEYDVLEVSKKNIVAIFQVLGSIKKIG